MDRHPILVKDLDNTIERGGHFPNDRDTEYTWIRLSHICGPDLFLWDCILTGSPNEVMNLTRY